MGIEMYSMHNEGRCVVAEKFIRTLMNKIYKYMTSTSKNVYIDKLDDIVNKFNNTYHSTIKMRHVDVKPSIYIESSKEMNNKNRKFKIGVTISKYKNIFANWSKLVQMHVPNWSKEVFLIKKVKNTVPWKYVISALKGEEIVGMFYQKELQKLIHQNLLKRLIYLIKNLL